MEAAPKPWWSEFGFCCGSTRHTPTHT